MNESQQYVPLQEINSTEDIANSILWLASSDASFVTGEILTVDGGQSLTTNKYSSQIEKVFPQAGWNLFGGGKK